MRLSVLLFFHVPLAAQKLSPEQLTALAKTNPNALRAALTGTFPPDELRRGTAVSTNGPEFLWAVENPTRPVLLVDNATWPEPMQQLPGEGPPIWFQTGSSQRRHLTQLSIRTEWD